MELHPFCGGTSSRVDRNIRFRAERLARSGAVPGMDADDIAQELRLDLIERQPKYDPHPASFPTFADRVIANRIASLAAPIMRLKAQRAMLDLDAPTGREGEGSRRSLAETLPESASLRAATHHDHDHGFDLRHDVGRLLRSLPPTTRIIAAILTELSATEAARVSSVCTAARSTRASPRSGLPRSRSAARIPFRAGLRGLRSRDTARQIRDGLRR